MDSNYLTLLFSNPHLSPIGVLSIFLLIFVRLIPIVSQTPFLGAKLVPPTIRIGFAISLAFIFLPSIVLNIKTDVPFDSNYLFLTIKELLIGFIIGFIATVPFYIAQTAGTLIDYQRGSSSMMAQDLTMQSQSSPIGILYNNMLLVIFFEVGGAFFFISTLMKSFQIVPVNGWLNPNFFSGHMPFWIKTFSILNIVTAYGIQLAAPALVAILMAEAFLGIANRLAPQVQIAFLGLSLKSFLGLALLFVSWFLILKVMGSTAFEWFRDFSLLFDNMGDLPAK